MLSYESDSHIPHQFLRRNMEAYQERVVQEKKELDEKISKLNIFLQSDDIDSKVDIQEKSRLVSQLCAMTIYSNLLFERIANF